MKRVKRLRIAIISLIIVIFSIGVFTIATYSKKTAIRRDNIEKIGMKIVVDKKKYNVELDNNETVLEVLQLLPEEIMFVDYENAFYMGNLGNKVISSGEASNNLLKNNIYYHPGWGGLLLVYNDYNFVNEKMIHIGKVKNDFEFTGSMTKIIVDTNEKD